MNSKNDYSLKINSMSNEENQIRNDLVGKDLESLRCKIKIQNLTHKYVDKYTGETIIAIQDLNLDVFNRELLTIVGPSGCGKSTFLRCLNGLIPNFSGGSFSGKIISCNLDILVHGTFELSQKVGLVFQDPENQFIMSNVESEIAFGLENLCLPPKEISKRLNDVTTKFGIKNLLKRDVSSLSGGEKQKTILASIYAMKPEMIVLDEPTSQLDPKSAQEFLSLLKKLNDEGTTIVLAEHRLEKALGFADRVFDMETGKCGLPHNMVCELNQLPAYTQLALNMGCENPPLSEEDAKKYFENTNALIPHAEVMKRGDTLIEFQNVSKKFNEVTALSAVNVKICRGDFILIAGKNGSGKSTLFRSLIGLVKPDSGKIIFNGNDITGWAPYEAAKNIGYVGQNPNDYLFSDTVYEELKFSLDSMDLSGDIDATLDLVGISALKDFYPRDLSAGQRQLTALASILVLDSQVLVFDEPTRGVDYKIKLKLINLLRKLSENGKTIIVITHDIETFASYSNQIIVLDDGRVHDDSPTRTSVLNNLFYAPSLTRIFGKPYLSVEDFLAVNK